MQEAHCLTKDKELSVLEGRGWGRGAVLKTSKTQ